MKTLNAFSQLVVLVSLPLLLGGCGEKHEGINWKELDFRDGYSIAYLKGSDTRYTGKAVLWHENGQKEIEVNGKDGEIISSKYWNSKGELIKEIPPKD